MLHDLTKRLIDRIHALTVDGKVEWAEGPSKTAYSFEADGYTVVLDASTPAAMLSIVEADGRELETVSEDELSEHADARGRDYETLVREMWTRARRAALGTDHAIERILDAIEPRAPREREGRRWT